MNIIITGSSGFIASNFLDLYSASFSTCTVLVRKKNKNLAKYTNVKQVIWNLNDPIEAKISSNTVFIHTAYDSTNLKNNLAGLKNCIDFIQKNAITKFVYLSSFSVYNPFFRGKLTENSAYSTLHDPYSHTKIQLEKYLKKVCETTLKNSTVIAIQPTIVYGLWGNWSLHAIKTLHAKSILLPDGICSPVHVNDVAKAINLSCLADIPMAFHKILISSKENISWYSFYKNHGKIIEKALPIKSTRIVLVNKFHENYIKNLIYTLFFSKTGVFFTKLLMPLLRKLKPINTSAINIKDIIAQGKLIAEFIPYGMNRIVHKTKFDIDISKAENLIGFIPENTLENSLNSLKTKFNHEK